MNSKKKNKNRQNKPPNPTPPQKKEDVEEIVVSPKEKTESVIEERVPNIVSENVPVEVKEAEDAPKKPKRNRGKKKKEDGKSDKEDDIKVEESEPVLQTQPVEKPVDDVNITPTARKKKNKNKKSPGLTLEQKSEETEVKSEVKAEEQGQPQDMPVEKVEEPEQEEKPSKKKNKKKKNRNDSERSEKEEISCTSAFQKLLVSDDQTQKNKGDEINQTKQQNIQKPESTVDNIVIPDTNTVDISSQTAAEAKSHEEESHEAEGQKNKKKNKKNKKQIPTDIPKISEDTPSESTPKEVTGTPSEIVEDSGKSIIEDTANINIMEDTPSTSTNVTEEKSPKVKAKIAKPVEKKKKGKGNAEKTLEIQPESVEEPEVHETEIRPVISPIESELPQAICEESVQPPETSPNWLEEVKTNEGNGPVIGCEEKNVDSTLITPDSHLEKNKKRKKSPKPPTRNEKPIGSEVSSQNILEAIPAEIRVLDVSSSSEQKSEVQHEVQPKMILPDLPPADTNEKRQKTKKSPKPSRKIESASTSALSEEIKLDTLKVGAEQLPCASGTTTTVEIKPDDSQAGQPDLLSQNIEVKKDDVERIKTLDTTKKQKGKKSPKSSTSIDGSSSQHISEKERKDVINIDDLIIIQAEVVSEDKARKGETFIASETDIKSQDVVQKIEVQPSNEKSKTGKKSPKPSKKQTGKETKVLTEKIDFKETSAEIQIPVTPKTEETKILPDDLPVELEKPKEESMPSPSDVTPDVIEYPRCSSEQLLDTNNNMVIQEIASVENKLEVPIMIPETPFIQSKTLQTPELTCIKVTNTEPVAKPSVEKTDLKSKVMEVNQDMEELRLSIERSLAELTSLEKNYDEIEKKTQEKTKNDSEKLEKTEVITDVPKVEPQTEPFQTDVCAGSKETFLPLAAEEPVSQEPICPERKDRKGKGKSKKKGKQEVTQSTAIQSTSTTTESKESIQAQDTKKEDMNKSEQKTDNTQEKGKQQSSKTKDNKDDENTVNYEGNIESSFEPIESFEDAMTSSLDDVNQTFEIIANEANPRLNLSQNNPEINIIAPQEEDKGVRQEKQNPVSPPKNLLGHPDIPVPSSKTDYKKEKNKTPNCRQAKVKIKDTNQVEIESPEKSKQSKESQTENKRRFCNHKKADESICITNKNDDYVYKYSFRKVFLQCACHVCKKDLTQVRLPCCYCNLVFYCSQKHKDEDYAQHQAFCFAVSTIVHLKDQKFIYADARNVTGHNYRLLRMQMIVSCEKILKRRLAPWEQEVLLYPRICADAGCREWRQGFLKDCEGCGQLSFCSEHPDHLPKSHARWCKSYYLYRALVRHQQTKGRLEPKLPTRVLELSPMPDNINEVLANMYEERIDMSDIEYAALTQLATAPLTALYCLQAYTKSGSRINGLNKKSNLTLHIVGAELQFEADVLNKWEIFLLHLMPDVKELRVVLVGPDLNPSNLPLDLLGKIRLCVHCQKSNRRILFNFQDKRTYHEFWASDDFTAPELVCAFNPSIQRSSAYNGKDSWPITIKCILKLKVPFAITSYTLSELNNDLLRIQECAGVEYSVICAPKTNSFASVRPDRNFISDDETPLLFKNHCVSIVCGV